MILHAPFGVTRLLSVLSLAFRSRISANGTDRVRIYQIGKKGGMLVGGVISMGAGILRGGQAGP